MTTNIERMENVLWLATMDNYLIAELMPKIIESGLLAPDQIRWYRRTEFNSAPVGTIVVDGDHAAWRKDSQGVWSSTEYDGEYNAPAYAPCRAIHIPEENADKKETA